MSPVNDPALLRTAHAYAKQQYERETVRAATPAGASLDRIGAPYWDPQAWELFLATYGRYPSFAEGDLPDLRGAPPWVFEKLGMRQPPVDVTTGSAGASYPGVDKLTLWDLE